MLNIFLQFQVHPSNGSLVIAGEKNVVDGWTDRQMDGQTDGAETLYASSSLGGGVKATCELSVCIQYIVMDQCRLFSAVFGNFW